MTGVLNTTSIFYGSKLNLMYNNITLRMYNSEHVNNTNKL